MSYFVKDKRIRKKREREDNNHNDYNGYNQHRIIRLSCYIALNMIGCSFSSYFTGVIRSL